MVHYKLTYFNTRGLAETPRQLFALAGQDFEDVRLTHEEFTGAKKENTPFGHLPMLEIDGKQLAQSMAICRYLAREFELAGKTPFNEALVDSLADQFADYRNEILPFIYTAYGFREGNVR
ncbi:glutathione S-transferase protein [Oesophagostomum dentatum]|uniref:glutathione transferase n=1 Tax=Oesophagostomum dentatum TaxID=61180 RepID=A0A0B1SM37_OESDE|nr:glutathione S-transferase protein [Oesophagostomum dentatum]